jgi:guanylate kinase
VVSGPSGAGKSSVVAGLARRLSFHFSVSMTTRPPRPGEREGIDYFFVDPERFEVALARGDLVEWAEYAGHRYGTPRAEVDWWVSRGDDVLLDIEILGAEQVRRAYPGAVMVFIEPPDAGMLERRLRERGDTSEQQIQDRLAVAKWQRERARSLFDHFVVNDDLDRAVEEVTGILAAPYRRPTIT